MPSIYVESLAAYNSGLEHGVWIDLSVNDESEVKEEIEQMLKSSPVPGEEWAIHDYDDFYGLIISKQERIDDLCELAEWFEDNEDKIEAMVAYIECLGGIDQGLRGFDNNYIGEYDDIGAYAREFCEEMGYLNDLPTCIEENIDFDSMGEDFESELTVVYVKNGIAVFNC